LGIKVVRDLPREAGHLVAALHRQHLVLYPQQGVQNETQLDSPNPLPANSGLVVAWVGRG
jgi:hypothetical protein